MYSFPFPSAQSYFMDVLSTVNLINIANYRNELAYKSAFCFSPSDSCDNAFMQYRLPYSCATYNKCCLKVPYSN